MKCVKAAKQPHVRWSLLMAGLVMASTGAQASVTLTAGNLNLRELPDSGGVGSIIRAPGGQIELRSPNTVFQPIIQPPSASLHASLASSSVSGSMNYSVGGSSGNFSEYDSSSDGSRVSLEMNREGYGYRAEAAAEADQLKARAETKWLQSSNYGRSSASATSTWSDWFMISGGAGLGTASFASLLDGVMASAKNGSAAYSLNIGYSTGANCYYGYNACGEADQNQTLFNQTSNLSGKGKSTVSQEIEGEFTFAYDQAFQLTAMLNVNAANGGMADFSLASLDNSLVLPDGASLMSSSGVYVQAVPEAETYIMMLAGLGLIGLASARRRAIST